MLSAAFCNAFAAPAKLSSRSTITRTAGPAPLKRDPRIPCSRQRQQNRQQRADRRAIRLMNAIVHRQPQQIAPPCANASPSTLPIADSPPHLRAIARRQHARALLVESGSRAAPRSPATPPADQRATCTFGPRTLRVTNPPSQHAAGVVRMPFQRVRLFENCARAPASSQSAPPARSPPAAGRRRAAAHPQRNPVVHPDRQRHNRPPVGLEHLFVGSRIKIVLEPPAALRIAPVAAIENSAPARPQSPDKNPEPRPRRQIRGQDSPRWQASAAGSAEGAMERCSPFGTGLFWIVAHPTCPSARPAPRPAWHQHRAHCAAAPRSPPPGSQLLLVLQQRSAMEVDGVIGVLERVPVSTRTTVSPERTALRAQLLQPRQRHGRGRLAAQPSAPISALAMAISASVTSRHQPPVS
jgi:hypothetical protein